MSTELNNSASQLSLTLRQFFDRKQPATDEDRILVIAYYLEKFRGEGHFDYYRINDCFDELGCPHSSNPPTLLSHAKRKKLLNVVRERSPRTYSLTTLGKQKVEQMPRIAGSKRNAEAGPRQSKPRVQAFIQFKGETDLIDIHELAGDPLGCALWVLTVAQEYLGIEGLNTTDISDILSGKYGIKHDRRIIGQLLRMNSKWVTKKGYTYVIRDAGLKHVRNL